MYTVQTCVYQLHCVFVVGTGCKAPASVLGMNGTAVVGTQSEWCCGLAHSKVLNRTVMVVFR